MALNQIDGEHFSEMAVSFNRQLQRTYASGLRPPTWDAEPNRLA